MVNNFFFCKVTAKIVTIKIFYYKVSNFNIIKLIPVQEQKTELFAMKTMVMGRIFEHTGKLDPDILTPKNLHEYAYSLPICCMLSGCETVEQVEQNTAILKNFKGLDPARRDELVDAVEKISGSKLEYYKKKT